MARSPAEAVGDAEVVVAAPGVAATIAILRDFPAAPQARVILDVASVKVPVVAAAANLANFVATHPIAGSERSGPEAARSDLFAGRAWALVHSPDSAAQEAAVAFVRSLGGRPFSIGAARHDALIAFSSHLPQIVATALGALLADRFDEAGLAELCGPGLRSSLRLAESAWSTWDGILDANAEAVAQEVRGFADVLRSVADDVERRDREALARRFAASSTAVRRLGANDASSQSVSLSQTLSS